MSEITSEDLYKLVDIYPEVQDRIGSWGFEPGAGIVRVVLLGMAMVLAEKEAVDE